MCESIKEELEKVKKDKLIIIICLIMPIMINLVIGFELSKGVINHIPMGVVVYDDSQLSRQIVQYFRNNDSFDLRYIAGSQKELEQLMNESKIKVGMIIPEGFSEDVTSLHSPTILMLYDGSHMSMTSIAKAKASEILVSIRTGAAIKQLQGRLNMTEDEAYHTAMPISFENRTLYNPAKNFSYFMTPGYGTIICQTGIALTAVLSINLISNNRKRILGYTAGKVVFYGAIGSLAFITNILAQMCLFNIPFRGSVIMAFLLSILLAFAISSLSAAVSAWVKNRVIAIVVVALLVIPNSIMAGYTWPILSMIPLYKKVSYIIPFYHYGDNIRNLFLKGNLSNPAADIRFLAGFSLIMVLTAAVGVYTLSYAKRKEAV